MHNAMHHASSSQSSAGSGPGRGPASYLGYCRRSGRYRMMDLPDYMANMQEGMSRWMNDGASAYQEILRPFSDAPQDRYGAAGSGDCGCRQCEWSDAHCECRVSDADVLVHARCAELRRIPITFENDSRRDRPVKLELGKFVTAGGRELGWPAELSATEFTLRPCDEQSVILSVAIRCGDAGWVDTRPAANATGASSPASVNDAGAPQTGGGSFLSDDRQRLGGSVDRCVVGYATIRAAGCITRPVVVAVAVLPDPCDAYHQPCGCTCCH